MRMGFREVERRFEGTQEVRGNKELKNNSGKFANCKLGKAILTQEEKDEKIREAYYDALFAGNFDPVLADYFFNKMAENSDAN